MSRLNTRGDGWTPLHCIEGYAKSTTTSKKTSMSYSLLFRNGVIEGVDAHSLAQISQIPGGPNDVRYIRTRIYEDEIRHAFTRYVKLSVLGPFYYGFSHQSKPVRPSRPISG